MHISLGAVLYRGPRDREDGTYMCQVKDPYGNLIGFVGPVVDEMSKNDH